MRTMEDEFVSVIPYMILFLKIMFGKSYTPRRRECKHANNVFAVLNDKEKEKVIQQLQVEIDSNLSIVQEIDNQITQLHCRRGELIRKNENKKRLIAKIAIDDQKVR